MKFNEKQNVTNFRVGLFIIISIIILVLGYLWLVNYLESGQMTKLTISFQEAGALELGDGVLILGVNRGKVTDIRLDLDRVLVDIAVKLESPLRSDSEFWIKNTSVMGSTRLIIKPGNKKELLPLNETITGKIAPGLSDVIEMSAGVLQEVRTLFQETGNEENIIDKVNVLTDSMLSAVNNINRFLDNNEADMNRIVSDMVVITEDLKTLIKRNENSIDNTITGTEKLVAEFSGTTERINHLSEKTQELLNKIQDSGSTFGKLTSEDELYQVMLRSVTTLDSLLLDIKKNPRRYFTVKVF